MDLLRHAKAELKSAERAISTMKVAKTFEDFEESWKFFLISIEKCWTKIERAFQHKRNTFEPWQGQYKKLRKNDRLLRYIHHARNVDQHTVQEIVEHIPGYNSIAVPVDGEVYIEKLETDGSVINYIGTKPPIISLRPSRIELCRIKDRGDWYNPPTRHLELNLSQRDPISVAQKGFEFYSKLLTEAEQKFGDR